MYGHLIVVARYCQPFSLCSCHFQRRSLTCILSNTSLALSLSRSLFLSCSLSLARARSLDLSGSLPIARYVSFSLSSRSCTLFLLSLPFCPLLSPLSFFSLALSFSSLSPSLSPSPRVFPSSFPFIDWGLFGLHRHCTAIALSKAPMAIREEIFLPVSFILNHSLARFYIFQNGATSGFEAYFCFRILAPLVPGSQPKTRLEYRFCNKAVYTLLGLQVSSIAVDGTVLRAEDLTKTKRSITPTIVGSFEEDRALTTPGDSRKARGKQRAQHPSAVPDTPQSITV